VATVTCGPSLGGLVLAPGFDKSSMGFITCVHKRTGPDFGKPGLNHYIRRCHKTTHSLARLHSPPLHEYKPHTSKMIKFDTPRSEAVVARRLNFSRCEKLRTAPFKRLSIQVAPRVRRHPQTDKRKSPQDVERGIFLSEKC